MARDKRMSASACGAWILESMSAVAVRMHRGVREPSIIEHALRIFKGKIVPEYTESQYQQDLANCRDEDDGE